MKDYELIEKLEKIIFQKTENINFLNASLQALDDSIEEKRDAFEQLLRDYDDKAKRTQESITRLKDELGILYNKLNDARGVQYENAKKRALMHKVKKIKEARKPERKEPEPVFIEAPKEEEAPEEPITPEEIIETVPEETEKNENGKKTCPFCGDEFAPQGFKAHLRKCLADVVDSKENLP